MRKYFIYCFLFSLILFIAVSSVSYAQIPQYYNYNNVGSGNNTFPFATAAGKAVNWLFLPGDFNQPTPLPPGNSITAVYFLHSTLGERTFTDLLVLMGQDSIITLTLGQFYPLGNLDTVFYSASHGLRVVTALTWSSITLDKPFPYDPTKSLIIFVGHCGGTGTGLNVRQNTLSGIRRVWSVGGCPFAPYSGGDGAIVNFGVDVIPTTGVNNTVTEIPDEYKLFQNYPNPFNPLTEINYSLPENGFVTLKVYDLLGREVAALVSEMKTAGNHSVKFDASKLSSGVYLYRLEVNGFTDAKRMILTK